MIRGLLLVCHGSRVLVVARGLGKGVEDLYCACLGEGGRTYIVAFTENGAHKGLSVYVAIFLPWFDQDGVASPMVWRWKWSGARCRTGSSSPGQLIASIKVWW